MYRKYRDLLPSYLCGENILAHSSLIEYFDKQLDDKIELMGLWNVLERPILIQKNQTWNNDATLNVYVNTKTPIREIHVKGTYNGNTITADTITYEEDDLTTTHTLTYSLYQKIYVGQTGVNLPVYTVQVTTYDERVYTKKWPENDTPMGDSADHDEFLDIIGAILRIQRRKYSRYLTSDVALTVPPYMAKEKEGTRIKECTEDDYDYYARLKEFVTGFEETELLTLMANVLYSVDSIIVEWDTTRWYPVGLPALTIPLYLRRGNYSNYPVTNITGLLENYVPVTRELLTFFSGEYIINLTGTYYYPNYAMWKGTVTFKGMPVENATLKCYTYEDGQDVVTVYCMSDATGEFQVIHGGNPLKGTPYTMHVKGANLPTYASPQQVSPLITPYSVFYMELPAWTGRKYEGTPITTTTDISKDTTTGDITAGHGVLCYTPALDLAIVSTSAYKYTVSFHYNSTLQRLGFAMVTEEDNTATYHDGVLINVADYLGSSTLSTTHTLTAKFLEDKMYLYLDGNYTSRHYDYTGITEGVINLVAFNNRQNTGEDITVGSCEVAQTDITEPPVYTGNTPTSLDIDYTTNWNSYTPTEAGTNPTTTTTITHEVNLGLRQRVVYKQPLDLSNKKYTIQTYCNNTWQRIGLLKNTTTETGTDTHYTGLRPMGITSVTPGVQTFTLYLEDGKIKAEYNNNKQTIYSTYSSDDNYYLYFYTIVESDKVVKITEENNT